MTPREEAMEALRLAVKTATVDLVNFTRAEVMAAADRHAALLEEAARLLDRLSPEELAEAMRGSALLDPRPMADAPGLVSTHLTARSTALLTVIKKAHGPAKDRHRRRIRELCRRLLESAPSTEDKPIAYNFIGVNGEAVIAVFLPSTLYSRTSARVVGVMATSGPDEEADDAARDYVMRILHGDTDGFVAGNMTEFTSDEDEAEFARLRDQPSPSKNHGCLVRGTLVVLDDGSHGFLAKSYGWRKIRATDMASASKDHSLN